MGIVIGHPHPFFHNESHLAVHFENLEEHQDVEAQFEVIGLDMRNFSKATPETIQKFKQNIVRLAPVLKGCRRILIGAKCAEDESYRETVDVQHLLTVVQNKEFDKVQLCNLHIVGGSELQFRTLFRAAKHDLSLIRCQLACGTQCLSNGYPLQRFVAVNTSWGPGTSKKKLRVHSVSICHTEGDESSLNALLPTFEAVHRMELQVKHPKQLPDSLEVDRLIVCCSDMSSLKEGTKIVSGYTFKFLSLCFVMKDAASFWNGGNSFWNATKAKVLEKVTISLLARQQGDDAIPFEQAASWIRPALREMAQDERVRENLRLNLELTHWKWMNGTQPLLLEGQTVLTHLNKTSHWAPEPATLQEVSVLISPDCVSISGAGFDWMAPLVMQTAPDAAPPSKRPRQ